MTKVLKPIVCSLFFLLLVAIEGRDYNMSRVFACPQSVAFFIEQEDDPCGRTADYLHINRQGNLSQIFVFSIHSDLYPYKCMGKGVLPCRGIAQQKISLSFIDHLNSAVFSMSAVDYYVYGLRKIIT